MHTHGCFFFLLKPPKSSGLPFGSLYHLNKNKGFCPFGSQQIGNLKGKDAARYLPFGFFAQFSRPCLPVRAISAARWPPGCAATKPRRRLWRPRAGPTPSAWRRSCRRSEGGRWDAAGGFFRLSLPEMVAGSVWRLSFKRQIKVVPLFFVSVGQVLYFSFSFWGLDQTFSGKWTVLSFLWPIHLGSEWWILQSFSRPMEFVHQETVALHYSTEGHSPKRDSKKHGF